MLIGCVLVGLEREDDTSEGIDESLEHPPLPFCFPSHSFYVISLTHQHTHQMFLSATVKTKVLSKDTFDRSLVECVEKK